MSYGTDHSHHGEYADSHHDHHGDYAEQHHYHRDYAADGHDHDTSHDHPELTSREAVAAMLDAFRVDMHDRITANSAALAAAIGATSRTNDAALSALEERASALEALRDRVGELEGRVEQAEAARRNHNSQISHLSDRLGRLEAALDEEDQAPELETNGFLSVNDGTQIGAALADDIAGHPADVPPDICPGGC